MKILATLLALCAALASHAAELRIVAPPVVQAAMTDVAPRFERQSGYKVVVDYLEAGDLFERAKRDERVDAAILPVAQMGELARAYRILPDTRRSMGRGAPTAEAPAGPVFAIAALKGSDHEDAARAFCAYLTLPETIAALRRSGLAAP